MRQFPYVVTLKKSKEAFIDRISLLLCSSSVLALSMEQLRRGKPQLPIITGIVLISAGVIWTLVQYRRQKKVSYRTWLWVAGIFWISMPYWSWLALLYFAAGFLEHQAKLPLEIGFDADMIQTNGLPRKTYSWSAFNQVILKDGILTLDFKNNNLFQREVLDDDEDDADEEEFNAYCQVQLARQRALDLQGEAHPGQ